MSTTFTAGLNSKPLFGPTGQGKPATAEERLEAAGPEAKVESVRINDRDETSDDSYMESRLV